MRRDRDPGRDHGHQHRGGGLPVPAVSRADGKPERASNGGLRARSRRPRRETRPSWRRAWRRRRSGPAGETQAPRRGRRQALEGCPDEGHEPAEYLEHEGKVPEHGGLGELRRSQGAAQLVADEFALPLRREIPRPPRRLSHLLRPVAPRESSRKSQAPCCRDGSPARDLSHHLQVCRSKGCLVRTWPATLDRRARMAEWQTRRPQKPLSERACGFKSRSGHRVSDTESQLRGYGQRCEGSSSAR